MMSYFVSCHTHSALARPSALEYCVYSSVQEMMDVSFFLVQPNSLRLNLCNISFPLRLSCLELCRVRRVARLQFRTVSVLPHSWLGFVSPVVGGGCRSRVVRWPPRPRDCRWPLCYRFVFARVFTRGVVLFVYVQRFLRVRLPECM